MNDYLLLFKTVPLAGPPKINVRLAPNSTPTIESDQPVLVYVMRAFKDKYGIPEAGTNVTLYLTRMPITTAIKEFTITPKL